MQAKEFTSGRYMKIYSVEIQFLGPEGASTSVEIPTMTRMRK